MPDFPSDLRAWLKANDVSVTWFAHKLGVNRATVTRWLSGSTPSPTHRMLIRHFTRISL